MSETEFVTPTVPEFWILDEQRTDQAVESGRHPGAVRVLSAAVRVDDKRGAVVATAFELPATDNESARWHVDIECLAMELTGLPKLGSTVTSHGFAVQTETEARDWLQFLGTALARVQTGGTR